MCAVRDNEKPNLITSIFSNKCPRCRRGEMYEHKGSFRIKGLMKMHQYCPSCGQPFDMEPGFYYGTHLVSYALALLICIISFFAWFLLIGISLNDARFFWWVGVNAMLLIILQPSLMRFSRTVWLYIFVKYSPKWYEGDIIEAYRVNKEQANNW